MADSAEKEPKPCNICGMVETGSNLIYSDDYFSVFSFFDRPGWVLYGCNRHAEWIWGLTDEEADDFGRFLRTVAGALKEVTETTHIYNTGMGENSLHFHGILAARYQPFAKDVMTAMMTRGGEVADEDETARIALAMRKKLEVL
jgi:diadenosine tetraphosphate (Ap4A) HIT family hydrolase